MLSSTLLCCCRYLVCMCVCVFPSSSFTWYSTCLWVSRFFFFLMFVVLWIKGDATIRDRKVCLWKFSVCQLIFAAFVFFFFCSCLSLSFLLSLLPYFAIFFICHPMPHPHSFTHTLAAASFFSFFISVNFFCSSHSLYPSLSLFRCFMRAVWTALGEQFLSKVCILSGCSHVKCHDYDEDYCRYVYGRYTMWDTWTLLASFVRRLFLRRLLCYVVVAFFSLYLVLILFLCVLSTNHYEFSYHFCAVWVDERGDQPRPTTRSSTFYYCSLFN